MEHRCSALSSAFRCWAYPWLWYESGKRENLDRNSFVNLFHCKLINRQHTKYLSYMFRNSGLNIQSEVYWMLHNQLVWNDDCKIQYSIWGSLNSGSLSIKGRTGKDPFVLPSCIVCSLKWWTQKPSNDLKIPLNNELHYPDYPTDSYWLP